MRFKEPTLVWQGRKSVSQEPCHADRGYWLKNSGQEQEALRIVTRGKVTLSEGLDSAHYGAIRRGTWIAVRYLDGGG